MFFVCVLSRVNRLNIVKEEKERTGRASQHTTPETTQRYDVGRPILTAKKKKKHNLIQHTASSRPH